MSFPAMNRLSPGLPVRPVAPSPVAGAADRSPSGLFTRQDWLAELDRLPRGRTGLDLPVRERPGAATDFARWVHARAKTAAAELERLDRSAAAAPLARHLDAVSRALWADAEWARHRLDPDQAVEETEDALIDAA